MPFRHVVMFRWADHVDADHVERVRTGLDALPAQIPEIRRYVHGRDVGVSGGNFDYALVADFDGVDDFRVYRDHPSHVLFIEEVIAGHVAERSAVQFVVADEHDAARVAGADDDTDDELLARARRIAMAEMQALLAEPEDAV